jgi:hypothetical protein
MTAIQEYRAWVRAITRLSIAISAMDTVPFLGIGPEFRAECEELWERMDSLKSKMETRIEEMEKELEGCKE